METIEYLTSARINKSKWDACIADSFNGNIYGHSWYLDIACPGWHALVLGDYHAVCPLPVRVKAGIDYVYQPFFIQQLGVFARGLQKLSPQLTENFLDAVPARFRYIHYNLNTYCSVSDRYEPYTAPRLTHHLDLIHSYEKAAVNYSTNLKRNLKKARAAGIEVVSMSDAAKVIDLFKRNKGRELPGIRDMDYENLHALVNQCMQRHKAEIYGVYRSGDLCAGAVFVESNQQAIFLFSALNESGRSVWAMPLIIDNFIKLHSGKNIVLDFEGSMIPDLARFYKSFGSKECVYLQVTVNNLPAPFRWLKKGTSLQR